MGLSTVPAVPDLPGSITRDIADALTTVLAPVGTPTRLELLTGGMFATTYRATLTDGTRVIVKTAPTATDRLLTYELDLLRSEAQVYALAADRPDLLMPQILHEDFTRAVLPSDVLVVTHVPGVPMLDAGELSAPVRARLHSDLGALMARLHTMHGDRFGYLNAASGLVAETWPDAFGLMVGALLDDAARWGTPLPVDEVRAALVRHADALAEITTPTLVHTDLWPGNLFIDPTTGELVGVIDTERSAWADPLLELVGRDPFARTDPAADLLAAYESAGGRCELGTASGRTRFALYRMYLGLVMTVEIAPRAFAGDWLVAHRASVDVTLRDALNELR